MGVKIGILFLTLLAGSFAIPKPEDTQPLDSDLFYHTDAAARIVGGAQAADGSAPYMVALSNGLLIRSFVCGGSVINIRTLLTAAHCIEAVFSWGSLSSSLRATVGTNRWNSGGQTYTIQRNVTHQNYVSDIIKNDLGLLITSSNVVFSNTVAPVALSSGWVGGGVNARAAGWGRIRHNGALSATLLELFVSTVDGDSCVTEVAEAVIAANIRNAPPVMPHIEICTANANGAGFGMCNGDSGSALVRTDNGLQIGIVSWGIPCARGAPDMFVRVSAYIDWITANWV